MKKSVLIGITFILSCIVAKAQFNFSFPGATGWSLYNPATYINVDTLILDASNPDTSGFAYYNTSFALTPCAGFQVDFDFRIKNDAAQGPGDGMAFWILNAPPAGTVLSGAGEMGVPNGSVGVGLFFDTHDDDALPDNPLASLVYLTGTNNYVEGVTSVNTIGTVNNLVYMTDSLWHHCKIVYNNGNWKVYMNSSSLPTINGNQLLSNITTGYFGFSSSTSTNFYSEHDITNVVIQGSEIAMPSMPPTTTINLTYCQDLVTPNPTVSLDGTVTGDSLIWYDSTGTQLSGAPSISLDSINCYTFYVSQYLNPAPPCGESPKDTVIACVTAKPPSPGFSYPPTYCVGEQFQPFPPVQDVYWYTTPVGGVGTNTPPVVSTTVADTFTFYDSRIINGCESDRDTVVIIVLPTPEPDFSYDILYGCVADTVSFTNLTPVADSLRWDFGDGSGIPLDLATIDSVKNPVHLYYSQAQFDVKLVAVNGSTGCTDSITKKMNNIHTLIAGFSFNDDTVCQGFEVKFQDTSIINIFGDQHFYWDFGDGVTDTLKAPSHIYTNPGVYQVMHVATDFVPCSDTVYHTFVVDSAGVMVVVLSDSLICEAGRITFSADFTDIGLLSYTWNFGDGILVDNINPINHTFDSSSTYTVRLTGEYRACPNDTTDMTVQVMPYPRINLGPDTTMCPNGPGIAIGDYNNQSNLGAKWIWSTGDSTAVITVRHPGIYTARVTEGGCSSSDSIEVFKDCYIDIPNSFTPNNDGVNDYFLPRQLLSKSVTKFNMQIFNRWGELVFKTEKIDGRGWDGKFNEKDQPVGVYIYLIDVVMEPNSPSSENLSSFTEHYQGNVTLLR